MYRPAVSLGRIIFTTCEKEINAKVLYSKVQVWKELFQRGRRKEALKFNFAFLWCDWFEKYGTTSLANQI